MIHKARDGQSLGDVARVANATELLQCTYLGDVPRVDKYYIARVQTNRIQSILGFARQEIDKLWAIRQESLIRQSC